MDIRHFRYFVAVAEALSFARAARDLNMSQPPLSKRIADLEGELSVKLFDRTSKKVNLTAAGEALLPQARNAMRAFEVAVRMARSLSPSQSRHLRIGFPPETSRALLSELSSRLQQQMQVHLVEASTAEQQSLLRAGEIDIGVLRHPFEKRGLRVSPPLGQPLGVVIHAEHPLAKRDKLRLSELSPYPLVHFQRHLAPGFYDELLNLCRAGGYVPPNILHSNTTMTKALLRIESAVAIVPERLTKRRREAGPKEYIWRPLEGSPIHWWTSVVCRSDECVGLTRVAFDVIFGSLQEHENWVPMPRPVIGRRSDARLARHRAHRTARVARKQAFNRA
ncbi:LysR family transcriptional regulator [Bradyrhizobium sp. 190]|uniref:LysR family transcriptional regulator n=1 Tax=Bradyrhizobium sp. 190 TaxID=2782658 RepID=UPI001FF9F422|nr:LysR substrate-binding domain-containing protein [Bradyrhizobium sp. 190]MCK1516093.1 LysR family transcriptional regulator [Bradyrhizobium sp. 190]